MFAHAPVTRTNNERYPYTMFWDWEDTPNEPDEDRKETAQQHSWHK